MKSLGLCYYVCNVVMAVITYEYSCADPEGGGGSGVWTPPKNHKNIGFSSDIGLEPMKNHKATKPTFNVWPSSARQRNAI